MHECLRHGAQSFSLTECYAGLKERARHGEQLTAEELAFVGFYEPRPPPRGGWQQPEHYVPTYEIDGGELSPEDSVMLSVLMDVPRGDQLEFLG